MDLLRKKRRGAGEEEELVKAEETTADDDNDGETREVKEDLQEISDANEELEEEDKE